MIMAPKLFAIERTSPEPSEAIPPNVLLTYAHRERSV